MARKPSAGPEAAYNPSETDANEKEFQQVWTELERVYREFSEQAVSTEEPSETETAAEAEAEFERVGAAFDKFFTEQNAVLLLPAEARQELGSAEAWRWCYRHIRCCFLFGWLVCRRCTTFRCFVYYLYLYWRCIRQIVGTPLHNPLTAEEQADFQVLVKALAEAYKPFLTDQLATVEFPIGLPDEVASGNFNCFDAEEACVEVFDRLLSADIAPALFGKQAIDQQIRQPSYWFCRCWCLCAIRFGCCLAHAHTRTEWRRCLKAYQLCLRRCFGPLTCKLTAPTGCTQDVPDPAVGDFVVQVFGTAGGGGFSHYVLEWSTNDIVYHATDFHYPPIPPGGGVQGNFPVFGGLLGDFATTNHDPGLYFIRLTVFSSSGATTVCKISFELLKKDVRITGIDSYFTMDTAWPDPAARFVETIPSECPIPMMPGAFVRPGGTFEVSFGDCLTIQGGAFVGGCDGKKIKRYEIDYKPGFETDCFSSGWTKATLPWPGEIIFDTIPKNRFVNWRTDNSVLTSYWGSDCYVPTLIGPFCAPFTKAEPESLLYPSCWQTHTGDCTLSGLYTLRLLVEATDGSLYCDTQRVWIDNKPICAMIRIDAVPKCADLFISEFAHPPNCGNPWSVPISGIAYDEYIDSALPLSRPNDNFDYYKISVRKQGGPSIDIPILGPGGDCFKGFSRVGNPGTTCTHCDPAHPDPSAIFGTLAQFDLRAIDPDCHGSVSYSVPDDFTTPRGDCCVYVFDLWVYDRTIRNTGNNWAWDQWPVKICNDLKKHE